jgi:hypothetical protein
VIGERALGRRKPPHEGVGEERSPRARGCRLRDAPSSSIRKDNRPGETRRFEPAGTLKLLGSRMLDVLMSSPWLPWPRHEGGRASGYIFLAMPPGSSALIISRQPVAVSRMGSPPVGVRRGHACSEDDRAGARDHAPGALRGGSSRRRRHRRLRRPVFRGPMSSSWTIRPMRIRWRSADRIRLSVRAWRPRIMAFVTLDEGRSES